MGARVLVGEINIFAGAYTLQHNDQGKFRNYSVGLTINTENLRVYSVAS